MHIKATIFIPTSKSLNSLRYTLQSLSQLTEKRFQVIIVSLSDSSELRALLTHYHFPIVHKVQKKKGLVEAANIGLRFARSKIFIRIDDDVTVSKGWLSEIVKLLANKKIGGVTGPTIITKKGLGYRDSLMFVSKIKKGRSQFMKAIRYLYGTVLYDGKLFEPSLLLPSGAFTLGSNFQRAAKLKHVIEVNNFEGCNFACKTDLLKKIGGFDRLFNKGLGEYHEADAAHKIQQLGYKILFSPKAWVYHRVELGGVMEKRPESFYRIRNFILFYRRHIKITSVKQLLQFTANVLFQNLYYAYKFISTGDLKYLSSLPGTIIGFFQPI